MYLLACFCFCFYSVYLNFSAATLVYGYPPALFGSCETLVFVSHTGTRKWFGFQDLRGFSSPYGYLGPEDLGFEDLHLPP